MRKHAKKSLLIPILALFSVIAIIAGCYMVQAVTAHADGEEVEAAAVEAPEVGVPAPGAEDPVTLGEEEPNPVPNFNPEPRDITAKIHLSTNTIFRYCVTESTSEDPSPANEQIAWFGEIYATWHEVNSVVHPWASYIGDTSVEYDGQQYVPICGQMYGSNVEPVYWINVTSMFYRYSGLSLTYDISENGLEASLTMVPAYYIKFDANGGKIYDEGKSADVDYIWMQQGEYDYLNAPYPLYITPPSGKYFSGWYTHPVWGERIDNWNDIAPAWGEIFVLYAHYVDSDEPITFNFSTSGFGQMFKYSLYKNWNTPVESGTSWHYNLVLNPDEAQYIDWDVNCGFYPFAVEPEYKVGLYVDWYDDNEGCYYELAIEPLSGQRINNINFNGNDVHFIDYVEQYQNFYISQTNNLVVSFEYEIPGFLSIASDDGNMFKVTQRSTDQSFYTDYFTLYINPNEYVEYHYGDYTPRNNFLGSTNGDEYTNNSGATFTILVHNFATESIRAYVFQNIVFSLFDWFDMNTYIHGVDIDGYSLPIASGYFTLDNGYHAITIHMTDKEADTTVTYKANGGKFADDSDTMTLDARFGEPLPIVENPKAIDNDFVGWFTEPEGGVQVDPEHFIWMPWQRETGVTLYAHWAYNPQPVPPEPVPPEPGPTPQPVNPDVPGGGGTAQTGDSMPLAPIAALALIAALGCGLAIRKEYF